VPPDAPTPSAFAPAPNVPFARPNAANGARSVFEARRSALAFGGAAALHIGGLVIAVVAVLQTPPPETPALRPIVVELVMPEPTPISEPVVEETLPSAEPDPDPPPTFDANLDVNTYALPDVLRMYDIAGPNDNAVGAGLSGNLRQALADIARCRLTREDDTPCTLASQARLEAVAGEGSNPLMFLDPVIIAAARVLNLAPKAPDQPLATAPDNRLSSSDGMRDRLPPSSPDPYFGD